MWIVTREINEYNQDGAYFLAAYTHKPSFADLRKLLPMCEGDDVVGKLTRGGGRHDGEWEWHNLQEVQDGESV